MTQVPDNEEISKNYVMSGNKWNRNQIDIDNTFACNIAVDILDDDVDHEPLLIG